MRRGYLFRRCDRLQEWSSQLTTHTVVGADAGAIARSGLDAIARS